MNNKLMPQIDYQINLKKQTLRDQLSPIENTDDFELKSRFKTQFPSIPSGVINEVVDYYICNSLPSLPQKQAEELIRKRLERYNAICRVKSSAK